MCADKLKIDTMVDMVTGAPNPNETARKRVVIFTSRKAGRGLGREQIPLLQECLHRHAAESELISSPEQLAQMCKNYSNECVVVAAGGDGTLALAAQSVDRGVALLPMPMGTENLLARYFGHTNVASKVAETVLNGREHWIDAGLANQKKLFLIMATCGFDAEVVRAMHLTRRGHINRLSYARPILRAIRKYTFPKLSIRIDDQPALEACWWMIFNLPRYGGGLGIEPDAVADDGRFDAIGFARGNLFSGLRYVAGIALKRHLHFRDVTRQKGTRFEITSLARVPYQLDGDYGGHLPLQIDVLEKRVKLLLPIA